MYLLDLYAYNPTIPTSEQYTVRGKDHPDQLHLWEIGKLLLGALHTHSSKPGGAVDVGPAFCDFYRPESKSCLSSLP
jgi:hypothetical protein